MIATVLPVLLRIKDFLLHTKDESPFDKSVVLWGFLIIGFIFLNLNLWAIPCVVLLIVSQGRTVLFSNLKRVMLVLGCCFSLCFLWFFLLAPDQMVLPVIDSAAGKLVTWGFFLLGVLSFGLAFSGLASLSALVVWQWPKISKTAISLLPQTVEPGENLNIGLDQFIYTAYEGEPSADSIARFREKVSESPESIYLFMVLFQQPTGVSIMDVKDVFPREDAPLAEQAEFAYAENWENETWPAYRKYLDWYAGQIRQNIGRYRVSVAKGDQKLETYLSVLTSSVMKTILLFFVCLSGLSAQDASLLPGFLSANIPEANRRVHYEFERGQFNRVSDGQKSIVQLLATGANASLQAGNYLRVTVDGIEQKPGKTGQITTARMENPLKKKTIVLTGMLPDSATAIQQIAEWKQGGEMASREFFFITFAYWDFISWWLHRNAFPLLSIGLFAFGAIAWGACSEYVVSTFGHTLVGGAFRNVHAVGAFLFWCCAVLILVTAGIDFMIFLILKGWGWIPLALAGVFGALAVGLTIGKATPNTRIVGRNGGGQRMIGQ